MEKKALILFLICIFSVVMFASQSGSEAVAIPQAYDLRNVDGNCYITPVKSQCVPHQPWNCVGLCWAFSSLASFESSLLKQGIASDPYSPEANLSPWHLGCHIGFNHPNYEFNDTLVGDPPVPISYQLDSTMQFGWGGSALFTIDFLSSGRGLVLEVDAPLPLERMETREVLVPPDRDLPAHYMLRKGLVYAREDYDGDREYMNTIKRAVMEYGALASPMYLGAPDLPGQSGMSFWRDDGYSDYYCDLEELTNQLVHLVTIAGWDDMKRIDGAPGDGAWLIKDSLGRQLHDGGYFWISYYDTVFLKGDSYAVSLVADRNEGYADSRYRSSEHTLSFPIGGSSMYESDGSYEGNRSSSFCVSFISLEDGLLKSVGLIAANRNEHVVLKVFESWDDELCEPSGEVLSEDFILEERGYHLIDLARPVEVFEGQEFVIVVSFRFNPDAQGGPLVYVTDEDGSSIMAKTFLASFSDDLDRPLWTDYREIRENSAFFLQAIMQDE